MHRLRERVPRGHVQSANGDHGHAFVADEMERLAGRLKEFHGRDPPAFQGLAQVVDGGNQVAQGSQG